MRSEIINIVIILLLISGCSHQYMSPIIEENQDEPVILYKSSRGSNDITSMQKDTSRIRWEVRVYAEEDYVCVELWAKFRALIPMEPRELRCEVFNGRGTMLDPLYTMESFYVDQKSRTIEGKLRFWNREKTAMPEPVMVRLSYGGSDNVYFKFRSAGGRR